MPTFDNSTPMFSRSLSGSRYGYSGTRIDHLGSSEYTLVSIAADQSGSVGSFRTEIEECIAEVVRACASSPHADNVMMRLVTFDSSLHEFHGFKPVPSCDPKDYAGCVAAGGATALYDASHNAVTSVANYGESLTAQHFAVNGVVFVITDGCDNASTLVARSVASAVADATREEKLGQVFTVLVGVQTGPMDAAELLKFSADAGFDRYIQLDQADKDTLAQLASFASRSIAMASTALAGGSSANIASLTF